MRSPADSRLNIRLRQADLERIARIRERLGARTVTEAVRMALELAAEDTAAELVELRSLVQALKRTLGESALLRLGAAGLPPAGEEEPE